MKKRCIMHIDMDAFYAAVEQLDNEAYRGKPVIVGGLSKRGVVSTCSYEARKYGIHSAMSIQRAYKLCPQGIFLKGNYKRYAEESQKIFDILANYSPLIEPLSIDEAFLDLTGMELFMKDPFSYGQKLKQEIFTKTGLIASVGIAPNKFLAKIASDLEKPDGLTIFTQENFQEKIDVLPVNRIWGVGIKTDKILAQMGIRTIKQLRETRSQQLILQLGERAALQLKQLSEGVDTREVIPRRKAKSIGNELTFMEDIQEASSAEQILLELSVKVGWRVRRADCKASTIQLKLRTNDFKTYTRQKKLTIPSNFDNDIFLLAKRLFRELGIFSGIRLLGVTASGFEDSQEISLFDRDEKSERLYTAIDSINNRFGPKGIIRANLLDK